MKLKANIDQLRTAALIHSILSSSLSPYYKELIQNGWQFYAVNQQRGRCYYRDKVITIPLWALEALQQVKKPNYWIWYVAHEMSHAFDKTYSNHGFEFMMQLKRICPADCVHYELNYKPANASAAGISMNHNEVANRKHQYILQCDNSTDWENLL